MIYSASNPDEGALIYAASHFGHRFLRRDGRDVVVAITTRREHPLALPGSGSTSARGASSSSMQAHKAGGGTMTSPPTSPPLSPGGEGGAGGAPGEEEMEEEEEEVTFQVLHTFPFTSDRKRSSVVVRKRGAGAGAEGVVVYCKGADNVVLERLDPEKNPDELVRTVKENIAEFTRDGEPGQESGACTVLAFCRICGLGDGRRGQKKSKPKGEPNKRFKSTKGGLIGKAVG